MTESSADSVRDPAQSGAVPESSSAGSLHDVRSAPQPDRAITERLWAASTEDLTEVALRWRDRSASWKAMTFTALALRELDFHSHHAGYGDPYGIEFAADSRAAELEPHPAAWLRDYGKYVNGAYELSAMGWPGLDDLPDPWS